MVYIKQIKDSDNKRWLGFLSIAESNAEHLHPLPVDSKIRSQFYEDLENTVIRDLHILSWIVKIVLDIKSSHEHTVLFYSLELISM
jgi:hypothetical protein